MACLALVFMGFWVGADGEVNFSLIGTLSGVISSLFVSLNSIYTKKVGTTTYLLYPIHHNHH